MLAALMEWEDKLLGRKFTLVTDHKGLKYFETQKNLLDRQVQWWEFLSHFNYTIMHVNGIDNKVVDCCYTVISGADNGVAKSDGGDVRGTWLQLMCCALPKCLCP